MAATLFLGFAAAVICTNTCIQREMKNGTMLLLFSKPVSRITFLLAKVSGITGGMIVFSVICCVTTMIMVLASTSPYLSDFRIILSFVGVCVACCIFGAVINYIFGTSFSECTILSLLVTLPVFYLCFYQLLQGWLSQMPAEEAEMLTLVPFSSLLSAMLLLLLAIVLMGMITTAAALHLSFLSNLVFCAVLFIAGLTVSPLIKEQFGEDSILSGLLCALIPNWQQFWMSYPLSCGTIIPGSYVGWMALYVLVYGMIWVIWAGVSFQSSELAKDSRS